MKGRLWLIQVGQDKSLIRGYPLAIVYVLNEIDITIVGRISVGALAQESHYAVNARLKLYRVITESVVLNDRGIDAYRRTLMPCTAIRVGK